MPEHDRPLDAPAEFGIAQEGAVSVHEVASVAGPGHDLRDERPAARVCEGLSGGPRVGARDDNGSGTALQHVRVDFGIGWVVRFADASAALIQGTGGLGRRRRVVDGDVVGPRREGLQIDGGPSEPRGQLSRQRLPVGQVQMDGARLARAGAERRGNGVLGDAAQHGGLLARAVVVDLVGHRKVGLESHARREQTGLARGLVRAHAAELRWSIGRQENHRHARVMRFERRRQEVRDRGPRRADDGGRHPALASDAEGGEPRDALVDAHVHGCRAARLELGGDESERLRARAGAHDHMPDPELDQPAEEGGGGIRRGGCRVGACHVRRAVRVARADRRRPQETWEARAAGRGRRGRAPRCLPGRGRRVPPRGDGCARPDR